jgi:hypothetical protein
MGPEGDGCTSVSRCKKAMANPKTPTTLGKRASFDVKSPDKNIYLHSYNVRVVPSAILGVRQDGRGPGVYPPPPPLSHLEMIFG